MTELVLHTPRCPVCGSLPADPLWSLSQLACPNDDCEAFLWDPTRPAAAQIAAANWTRLTVDGQDQPLPAPGTVPLGVTPDEVGTLQDAFDELRLRAVYHDAGYRCADLQRCPVCAGRVWRPPADWRRHTA